MGQIWLMEPYDPACASQTSPGCGVELARCVGWNGCCTLLGETSMGHALHAASCQTGPGALALGLDMVGLGQSQCTGLSGRALGVG